MDHEVGVVDNRVFLLGLDALYRKRIKVYERGRLLLCAREVARALDVGPADVPIEGYYASAPALTEYFRLVRALQGVPAARAEEVRELSGFRRLHEVLSSPLYGTPEDDRFLFPRGRNVLYTAIKRTAPDWTIPRIIEAAHAEAIASTDFSLVALTCLARDAVMVAASAESSVLYEAVYRFVSTRTEPEYVWRVDPVLEHRASRFVDTFNALFGEDMPRPCADNARVYGDASEKDSLTGRCVCIGEDLRTSPPRRYHWAIDTGDDGGYAVRDFWDTELWTTDRYTRTLRKART